MLEAAGLALRYVTYNKAKSDCKDEDVIKMALALVEHIGKKNVE